MKTTIALTCLLFCSVAAIPAAEAAQLKTVTVTPHVTLHTDLGAHGAGGGGGAGKVTVNSVTVTKETDSASPILFSRAGSTGGGGGVGKVTSNPVTVTKQEDSASPGLFSRASSTGGSGAGKTTASPYLHYQFRQVQVKSISW